jgi:hypothetical protein
VRRSPTRSSPVAGAEHAAEETTTDGGDEAAPRNRCCQAPVAGRRPRRSTAAKRPPTRKGGDMRNGGAQGGDAHGGDAGPATNRRIRADGDAAKTPRPPAAPRRSPRPDPRGKVTPSRLGRIRRAPRRGVGAASTEAAEAALHAEIELTPSLARVCAPFVRPTRACTPRWRR